MVEKAGRSSLVYQGKPVWNSCGAVQAQVGQLQAVQKPLQDVQHRGPLAEDQRVVSLLLHRKETLSQTMILKGEKTDAFPLDLHSNVCSLLCMHYLAGVQRQQHPEQPHTGQCTLTDTSCVRGFAKAAV